MAHANKFPFSWQLISVLVNFGLKCFSCVTVLMFFDMPCTGPLSDAPFYDASVVFICLFVYFILVSQIRHGRGKKSSPEGKEICRGHTECPELPWLDVAVSVSSLCWAAMLPALLSLLRCLEPWGLWWRWLCLGIRTPTNSVLWPEDKVKENKENI